MSWSHRVRFTSDLLELGAPFASEPAAASPPVGGRRGSARPRGARGADAPRSRGCQTLAIPRLAYGFRHSNGIQSTPRPASCSSGNSGRSRSSRCNAYRPMPEHTQPRVQKHPRHKTALATRKSLVRDAHLSRMANEPPQYARRDRGCVHRTAATSEPSMLHHSKPAPVTDGSALPALRRPAGVTLNPASACSSPGDGGSTSPRHLGALAIAGWRSRDSGFACLLLAYPARAPPELAANRACTPKPSAGLAVAARRERVS